MEILALLLITLVSYLFVKSNLKIDAYISRWYLSIWHVFSLLRKVGKSEYVNIKSWFSYDKKKSIYVLGIGNMALLICYTSNYLS